MVLDRLYHVFVPISTEVGWLDVGVAGGEMVYVVYVCVCVYV